MRVSYKGMSKDYEYRVAEISFDNNELNKIEYISKIMRIKGYDIDIVTDGLAILEVNDFQEFKYFMNVWKSVKKSVALLKKYNMAY